MPSRYPSHVAAQMRMIRETCLYTPEAICWWCGARPWNGVKEVWSADHVFPLMGAEGPMAGACNACNKLKEDQLPDFDKTQRLFKSPRVVRSVPSEQMLEIGRAECVRLWGRDDCIDLLMAALPNKKKVYVLGTKSPHKGYSAMLATMKDRDGILV